MSLLMWAGANPRSIGPAWGEEEGLEESEYSSAWEIEKPRLLAIEEEGLEESEYSSALNDAGYSNNVEILKRLKPDAKKDNLDDLLTCAAGFGRVDVVRYLLELGAKPNDGHSATAH